MINRKLIRLKVVQLMYANQEKGVNKIDVAEKEFMFSLEKSYDLYMYLLSLMVEVHRMAERVLETQIQRSKRLKEAFAPNLRFVENKFLLQLQSNEQLCDFIEHQKKTWMDEEEFVHRFFLRIAESPCYQKWMASNEPTTYEEDRNFCRRMYEKCFMEDEELDSILEEHSIYWNDDRFIVDSFVVKTIRQFVAETGNRQMLLTDFDGQEDRDFATRLFRASLLGADTYRGLVSQVLKNWEPDRVATMDMIILQVALAEMATFPKIPTPVIINEYVEIAKNYSTPKSGAFINGTLDTIAKKTRDKELKTRD